VVHHTLVSEHKARLARIVGFIAVTALLVLVLSVAGAVASDHAVPAPPANPTSADQIQNLDQVKTAIKGYYGDTLTAQKDPVDGSQLLHTYSSSGAYVAEMAGLESTWTATLDGAARHPSHGHQATKPLAIVLDVDDTTLNTYMYEIYSNFVYNPTTNAAFVNAAIFPPVPGMPNLAASATADGYAIFYITGRPESQRAGTVTNLTNAGYAPPDTAHLFLKDQGLPWLTSCTPNCTTTQYKTLTRQHIEDDLGYDIVGNFGDQFSDLTGGFADNAFKVPNPMYFLP
jgi:hypothetical protein